VEHDFTDHLRWLRFKLLLLQPACAVGFDYEYIDWTTNSSKPGLKPHRVDGSADRENCEIHRVLTSQMRNSDPIVRQWGIFSSSPRIVGAVKSELQKSSWPPVLNCICRTLSLTLELSAVQVFVAMLDLNR
jgi:hypothetical protein